MNKRIICNCCGKEIPVEQGIAKADYLHVKKEWGYFSGKDGRIQEFTLCENCYDDIVSRFQIPVESADVTELV